MCVDRGNFQIGGTGSAVSSKDNSQASSSTLLGLKDMSCVLLGEQDWPNTEHAVREVMAMEFLFQNHPKSIQKQSESTSENLKFPQKSTKICKVRNLASYDMCHGPHRTDEKGIATRLAYLLRFSMAEKVITAIAIPSRELKSRKTRLVYQSQWSNPAHKQTFPSRLQ